MNEPWRSGKRKGEAVGAEQRPECRGECVDRRQGQIARDEQRRYDACRDDDVFDARLAALIAGWMRGMFHVSDSLLR
ncbi:MAG: DUF429 domain-containing protein [Paraburkholderia sp.]|nr:MAG: DUF429 domain-containing protein [Paraburkholderia sp.]